MRDHLPALKLELLAAKVGLVCILRGTLALKPSVPGRICGVLVSEGVETCMGRILEMDLYCFGW